MFSCSSVRGIHKKVYHNRICNTTQNSLFLIIQVPNYLLLPIKGKLNIGWRLKVRDQSIKIQNKNSKIQ